MPNLIAQKDQAERIAQVLKAVAHPLRLRIVSVLVKRDVRVGELAELLGEKQAIVSQQLRILRMSGLVEVVKEHGAMHYCLAEPRLCKLVGCFENDNDAPL
ncbi:MAG: metalloregulator ArsR/SmtB family transcription factor [Myxococcota bacterium]|jgi:ArsR family transcriptional regulator|nr:metalloregulator ArsR/SmtB family transcription factor [Myxococcota bacterium]